MNNKKYSWLFSVFLPVAVILSIILFVKIETKYAQKENQKVLIENNYVM